MTGKRRRIHHIKVGKGIVEPHWGWIKEGLNLCKIILHHLFVPSSLLPKSGVPSTALQLLPFQPMESAPFWQFMACARPPWNIPILHYFSQKAIPALHQHVEGNIPGSLNNAHSSRLKHDHSPSRVGPCWPFLVSLHWVGQAGSKQ